VAWRTATVEAALRNESGWAGGTVETAVAVVGGWRICAAMGEACDGWERAARALRIVWTDGDPNCIIIDTDFHLQNLSQNK
jgi:hypothetical protein